MNQSFLLPSFLCYSLLMTLSGPSYSHVSSFLSFFPSLPASLLNFCFFISSLLFPLTLSNILCSILPSISFFLAICSTLFLLYVHNCYGYTVPKRQHPTLSHYSSSLVLPFLAFITHVCFEVSIQRSLIFSTRTVMVTYFHVTHLRKRLHWPSLRKAPMYWYKYRRECKHMLLDHIPLVDFLITLWPLHCWFLNNFCVLILKNVIKF